MTIEAGRFQAPCRRHLTFRTRVSGLSPRPFLAAPTLVPREQLGLGWTFEGPRRPDASVFVDHPRAPPSSRPLLARSTPPSARYGSEPSCCERLRGFGPVADRCHPLASFRWLASASGSSGWSPNTSWSPLRDVRYGDTVGRCASIPLGPGQRLRAARARSREFEGGSMVSPKRGLPPAARARTETPPREGSTPRLQARGAARSSTPLARGPTP